MVKRIVRFLDIAAERGDVGGDRGQPVGFVAAQMADAAQPAGAVGEHGHRGDGRGQLADVVQVDVDAAQLIRPGDRQPVRVQLDGGAHRGQDAPDGVAGLIGVGPASAER